MRPPEGLHGAGACQRVGVLSVDRLGVGVGEASALGDVGLPLGVPGPPIWLAAFVSGDVSLPVEPLLPMALVLPPGAGRVEELEDDVVGAGVWSRLVQAPSETAAANANTAHVSEDAFIGELLG